MTKNCLLGKIFSLSIDGYMKAGRLVAPPLVQRLNYVAQVYRKVQNRPKAMLAEKHGAYTVCRIVNFVEIIALQAYCQTNLSKFANVHVI